MFYIPLCYAKRPWKEIPEIIIDVILSFCGVPILPLGSQEHYYSFSALVTTVLFSVYGLSGSRINMFSSTYLRQNKSEMGRGPKLRFLVFPLIMKKVLRVTVNYVFYFFGALCSNMYILWSWMFGTIQTEKILMISSQ